MTLTRIFLTTLVLIAPTIAFAQHQGSLEDQLACTPDVYRLCAAQVPNEDAIVACLERNKPNLSRACQRVFSDKPAPGRSDPSNNDNDDDD